MRSWVVAATLALSMRTSTAAAPSFCDGPEAALGPSRDLYCIELVPAVGIRAGVGRVELGRTPGPFTVDVSVDGRLRYTPILTLSDLGQPSSLGRYTTYVAWVAPPTMDAVRRLGVVGNGRNVLAPVTLDKFVILVTAAAN